MNNPFFQQESSEESACEDDSPRAPESDGNDDAPRFGAVDIVEAFTAMRHEWRGQTKESRVLAELTQAAVSNLQSLESKLLARATDSQADAHGSDETAEAKPLALLIIETDHQLTRAVSAITQWEASRRLRAEADAKAAERYFKGMNSLARWFARPLLNFIAEQRAAEDLSAENPALEGLNLVLARLRHAMKDQGIERLEALGLEFDAETMHAIGTVETTDCSAGCVAEQLTPAYRWQGRMLRFADVRVAR